ncbi:MAG: SMI1/KNR4 family protein [Chthoniobacteraceae bacterium]|jgi:hypothetical protein
MKIKLKNGKAASPKAISAVEAILGCRLSASFRSFLQHNDGAEPETNIFHIGNNNECGVNEFIPLDQIPKERRYIENIPTKAYPVAWAEGGNYVFIDESKGGAVFFWDHEVPEEIVALAPNFAAFLEMLEPFDVKSVKLKPGQVKSVWVDPEFLKRLKK